MVVKIVITGDGLQYEGETSVPKAAQVIAFLGQSVGTVTDSGPVAYPQEVRPVALEMNGVTPRQALTDSGARSNPQKIAAFAKLLQSKGERTFTRARINEQFRLAAEALPKNIGRDLNEAVAAGYICEEAKDQYFITNQGMTAIEEQFRSEGPRTGVKKARRTPVRNTEPSNDAIKGMTFTSEAEGLIDYWDIPTKGDRILWILSVALKKGIKELDGKDIEYIGRQVADDIPAKNANALTKAAVKKNFVNRRGNTYTLLGKGIKYIAEFTPEK